MRWTLPIVLPLLAALSGCPAPSGDGGGGGATKPSTVEAIKARGKLVVATDAGYVPFEVIEPDGKITGFDVDLATAVAKDLGVELQIKNVAWNGIVGELRTGRCDAIFGGMSITEERQRAVLFSAPYFWIGQVVVKRKGDDRIARYTDLNDPSMTVAVQEATTGEQAVRRLLPKAKLLRFPKADAAGLAVVQQKADAVVFDHPYLMRYVQERSEGALEGIWEPFTREPVGVAVRKESTDLKAAIDATFDRLRASGEFDRLAESYFGEAAKVVPPGEAAPAPAREASSQE